MMIEIGIPGIVGELGGGDIDRRLVAKAVGEAARIGCGGPVSASVRIVSPSMRRDREAVKLRAETAVADGIADSGAFNGCPRNPVPVTVHLAFGRRPRTVIEITDEESRPERIPYWTQKDSDNCPS